MGLPDRQILQREDDKAKTHQGGNKLGVWCHAANERNNKGLSVSLEGLLPNFSHANPGKLPDTRGLWLQGVCLRIHARVHMHEQTHKVHVAIHRYTQKCTHVLTYIYTVCKHALTFIPMKTCPQGLLLQE